MYLDIEMSTQVQTADQSIETLMKLGATNIEVDLSGNQVIEVGANTEVELSVGGINGLVYIAYEATEPIDISLFNYPTGSVNEGEPKYTDIVSNTYIRYFPNGGTMFNHIILKGNNTNDATVKIVYAGNKLTGSLNVPA